MAFTLLVLNNNFLHAAFQEDLWGARPAGMAGAFTALADDANAPAYNPAGISYIDHHEFTMMYAQLFTGVDLQVGQTETSKLGLGYFSYVPQIKNRQYGSFGISWSNFVASNLLREDAFTLTYANNFTVDTLEQKPMFAYGANLKMLTRSFSTDSRTSNDSVFNGGRKADAYTGDIGLMAHPNFALLPGLKFGLAAQNITEPNIGLKDTDRVPAKYTLGVAYQDLRFRLLNPSLDISKRDDRTLVTMGWEGWMMKDAFAFRLGGNEDELAGGLGYQFKLKDGLFMRLDYALLWPLAVEGTSGSHRLSLTIDF